MLLLSSQFHFQKLQSTKIQKMISEYPHLSKLPQITTNRVKNDVYICPKGVKEKVITFIYVTMELRL